MKIEERVYVAATPAEAFNKLSDMKLLPSLMKGFMDIYPTAHENRFRSVVHMGPAPLGGEIELEFWPEAGTVVWHATRGVHQMGRFLVKPRLGGSELSLRLFYHLDGGLPSRLAEWVASRQLRQYLKEALRRAQRSIEAQPPRRRRQPVKPADITA